LLDYANCNLLKYFILMADPILEELNPQQKEAITHCEGPLLILAGAGSGKTRVITHKFAYLAKKHGPRSMLAVTFTNKAAEEMKERISLLLRKDLRNTWIGTFHSQCNKILRREIGKLGYQTDFTIYDEDDQSNLIRHILKEFKIYEALYKGILSRISSLKSCCVTPDSYLSDCDGFGFEEKLARVYIRYQDELKRCNAVDFDDLILLTTQLFREHPEEMGKYREMFSHILVDEFQDTNTAQYEMLKLLCNDEQNISVVGDDDQSIYGFRGANLNNILNFEKDFPDATVIKLEQNYRSTKNIIHISDVIIKSNVKRRDKKLWSSRPEGEKISQCWFSTEIEEAKHVAKLIKELYLKGEYDYRDFAVLYRINAQSRAIEEALRREKMPYRVLGGVSFYRRKEIKDLTAYMRLALNRDDNVSLRRVINTPSRGVGASTLSKLEQNAKKKSISLYASIKNVIKANSITASVKEKLEGFVSLIDGIASGKYKDSADMLRHIYDKSGYAKSVNEDRAEIVEEFILSAEGREPKNFVDELSLVTNLDEDCSDNAISLMTLHSAKGLEFPVVGIVGIEEGVLPYFKAQDPKEVSEERRLLYVGITRARDMLFLSGARKRRLFSKVQEQEISRFLNDLPEEICNKIDKSLKGVSSGKGLRRHKAKGRPAPYSVGCRVKHTKWGVGVVRDCYGEGDEQKITVNFPDYGIKRLSLKFANLEKIA
jgi:DNA helicase-2/ATP-dependent DNA helicase PcrA